MTDAPIIAGDSGGPLFNSADKSSASTPRRSTSGQTAGFAIPIDNAMTVAKQIETGVETSMIHIGYPGFLGVAVRPPTTANGVPSSARSSPGCPAAKAGHRRRVDVITAVDGTAVTSAAAADVDRRGRARATGHGHLHRHAGHVAHRDGHPDDRPAD